MPRSTDRPKADQPEIVDLALELFEPLGGVTARRMFGGWGFHHQGMMFALIAADTLYLKADAVNRPAFEAVGMPPFHYEARGRQIVLPYRQAPPEALEDAALMLPWARGAVDAALRAATRKPKKRSSH